MGISDLLTSLGDNPVFGGAIGVGILGAGVKAVQPLSRFINLELRRRLTSSREVTTNDKETFDIIAKYISEKLPSMVNHSSVNFSGGKSMKGTKTKFLNSKPSPGTYFTKYQNTNIMIERTRTTNVSSSPFESLKITTRGPPLGFASKNKFHGNDILDQLFINAEQQHQLLINDKIVIYEPVTADWRPFGRPIRKRTLNSVVLEDGQSERILADMKLFLGSEEWYIDKGISHQRGYLFYGPPGTGKTSFIKALAGALDFKVGQFLWSFFANLTI